MDLRQLAGTVVLLTAALLPAGAQSNDAEYTAKIREMTSTDPKWKFTSELVDHLPASSRVPTPLKVLGYVPGTPGKLSHVAEINAYFRAVEKASPRVKVFSLGKSEEGREMIVAAVADEATIKRLDEYRAMLGKLADPRGLSPAERARLIKQAKPIYWLSGSIHSPETGSPEMLMELLYRMAVEETPFVQSIRNNTITLITPQTEVDGRDREVDVFNYRNTDSVTIPLAYWGQYTAHDNNRDAIGMSAKLTRNMLAGFLYWHPTVVHDLHESVPFMYIMTGTGPYNDEFDPIVVNEWHTLAYNEMNEMAKRDMPGVWTHGFYDGWAPNYMLAMVNLHNSIGRFYETFSATGPGGNGCSTTSFAPGSQAEKEWDRFNPPVSGVRWCFRNNINYQQTGVLLGMKYVTDHKETFLDDFVAKAERLIKRGKTEAPYAYVIPHDQRRAQQAADLVNYFRMQGAEVQVAGQDFSTRVEPQILGRQGSQLLAQNTARVRGGGISTGVLASTGRGGRGGPGGGGSAAGEGAVAQAGNEGAGAAEGAAAGGGRGGRGGGRGGQGRGGAGAAAPTGGAARGGAAGADSATTPSANRDPIGRPATVHAGDWIIRMDQPYTQTVRTILAYQAFKPADDPAPYDDIGWTLDELYNVQTLKVVDSTILAKPMKLLEADAKVRGTMAGTGSVLLVRHLGDWRSAALPWKVKGAKVSVADSAFSANGTNFPAGTFIVDGQGAAATIADLGLPATAVASAPAVKSHAVSVPRIAYIHTWNNTQDEGWVRYAFDFMGIPYTYMADQRLADTKILDNYDVVIFPSAGTSAQALLATKPTTGKPIPWKKTAKTPNLGTPDSTDDTRGSMGLDGVMALQRFIARGGLFITEGATARLPLDLGFTYGAVSVAPSDSLWARGSVFRAQVVDKASPIVYGYDQDNLSVYYKQGAPLFNVGGGAGGGFGGRGGGAGAPAIAVRTILRMNGNVDSLLVSGGMLHGEEMAGKAAVVDVPLGKGHMVMFGIRPMWRFQTHGSFALVLNALANWNALK